jgi:hypothetical protein
MVQSRLRLRRSSSLCSIGDQHRGGTIDGLLARRPTPRAGTRGEDNRLRSLEKACDLVGGGVFEVADHRVGARRPHIVDVVGIPQDASDRVPVRAQTALKAQRDLAVATGDDHVHSTNATAWPASGPRSPGPALIQGPRR